MLASIIAPPLCFSFFFFFIFFYLLPFELWQTCAKSHSVLFSACCCCCTETNQFGKHHLLLLRKQRRQLKRHAELQLHTGCLSLSLCILFLLSQRCQLHVRVQAISTTKNAIKVKNKKKTLRYVIPYLVTAYTHTVYKDNYGGSATPCICMLSNTINSPHYATFRNTVILVEPPRQLDKSSSNPINNCMQKQK